MLSCWNAFRLPVLGQGTLYLVPKLDAMVMRNQGECEWERSSTTAWHFRRGVSQDVSGLRSFLARVEWHQLSLRSRRDDDLVGAVIDLIERGALVGVYQVGQGRARAGDSAEHQQAREIERGTRGKLQLGGRSYRLTVDLGLGAERDHYQVVGQDEAKRILDELARQPGTSAALAALLAQARDRLTRDWRPPQTPNGLILLRRVVAPRIQVDDKGPAMTPSQIRKAKLGWIIVELVDDEDEPWDLDVDLTSTDGSKSSYNFADDGVFSLDSIEPGSVTVGLKYDAPETSAPEEADSSDVPAEEPAPAGESESPEPAGEPGAPVPDSLAAPAPTPDAPPVKLRFKLLDLAANAIFGATVTVAGTELTTDSDGVVETDVAGGTSSVSATLPSGDVGLSVGSLDPVADDGWKTRLFNMGFLWDPSADDTDDEMVIALQDFQAQHQIPVSGQPDDVTKAKLVEVYGC